MPSKLTKRRVGARCRRSSRQSRSYWSSRLGMRRKFRNQPCVTWPDGAPHVNPLWAQPGVRQGSMDPAGRPRRAWRKRKRIRARRWHLKARRVRHRRRWRRHRESGSRRHCRVGKQAAHQSADRLKGTCERRCERCRKHGSDGWKSLADRLPNRWERWRNRLADRLKGRSKGGCYCAADRLNDVPKVTQMSHRIAEPVIHHLTRWNCACRRPVGDLMEVPKVISDEHEPSSFFSISSASCQAAAPAFHQLAPHTPGRPGTADRAGQSSLAGSGPPPPGVGTQREGTEALPVPWAVERQEGAVPPAALLSSRRKDRL